MRGVNQALNCKLKTVLVVEYPGVTLFLDAIEACQKIHRGLLIAWRRVFKISLGALKFEGVLVVGNEFRGNGLVQGYNDQAIVNLESGKDGICIDWSEDRHNDSILHTYIRC